MTIVNPGAISNNTTNVAHKLLVAWVDSAGTALVGPQGQNVPLGGGGVAISAGTNSQNTGTVNFSNANGFTWGLDGLGNLTATVIPGAAAGIAAIQVSDTTYTSGTAIFSNANGFSFGSSAGGAITGSYTVPTQSVQTQASGNIAGTGFTTTTTGGVVMVGTNSTNGLSLGIPNYITTYVAQSTQTQPAGNIAGAGTTTTTQAGSTLGATQNSNGLSLAVPLWITTYVGQSTQTQPAGNIAGIGTTTTTQAGSTLGATLSTNGLSLAVPAWLTAAAGGGGFTGGVSTGGNTLGNTGSQTGSIFFAGGNNITLSVSTAAGGAQTITISGANAGGAQTGISGIADANGTQTVGTVSFANSNGFTFGLSTGANTATMTASYTVPATAGLISGLNISGGAGNSQSKVSGMTFNNANGMTFGVSTGASVVTITGSYTVPTVTNSSWTVSDANTSATVGRLAFTQSNGLTLSLSTSNNGNHTVIGSYTVPSIAGLISAVNISGNGTSGNVTQIVYSNLNGMTFGVSTAGGGPIGTVTASYTVPSVTQYFSNTGTTFNGANISGSLTLNTSGLQMSLSVAAPGGGGGPAISAAGNSVNAGTVVFSNNGQVSFGMAGSTITASVNAGAAAGIAAINNSNTTYTSGTVQLTEGGGAITIASNTGQRFAFSVPQTSSLVGVSGVSVSTAGSTISVIGVPSYTALTYQNRQLGASSTTTGQNSLWLSPMRVVAPVSASTLLQMLSITGSSSSNTGSIGITMLQGLWQQTNTTNASVLDTLIWSNAMSITGFMSSSNSAAFTINGGAHGNNYTSASANSNLGTQVWGVRDLTFSYGSTLNPGLYVYGVLISTSSVGNSAAIRSFGIVIDNPMPLAAGAGFGGATNASIGYADAGTYLTTTNALPSTLNLTQIGQVNNVVPFVKLGAI